MGNRYQCLDCNEWFRAKYCLSCRFIIRDRCGPCHFDYSERKWEAIDRMINPNSKLNKCEEYPHAR